MTTVLQETDVCNVRAYAAYAPSHPVMDASTRLTKQFKQRSCQSCTSSSASAWKAGTEASSVDYPALAARNIRDTQHTTKIGIVLRC